jgi:hypothetical protein
MVPDRVTGTGNGRVGKRKHLVLAERCREILRHRKRIFISDWRWKFFSQLHRQEKQKKSGWSEIYQ